MDLGWGGLLQHTDQQINALLHHRSRLQMAAPHLAGPIGEAEVKVHTTGLMVPLRVITSRSPSSTVVPLGQGTEMQPG